MNYGTSHHMTPPAVTKLLFSVQNILRNVTPIGYNFVYRTVSDLQTYVEKCEKAILALLLVSVSDKYIPTVTLQRKS